MPNRYNVVCGLDGNYVQHASVMLMSLSQNNTGIDFDVYVLSMGLSTESKKQMSELFADSNLHVTFIDIDYELVKNFPKKKTDYLSLAAYLRLFIPKILPQTVSKVLYLDSDIIVDANIRELLDHDLKEFAAEACLDLEQENCTRLGYNIELGYYNSGVMYFNLDYLRKVDFTQKALDYLKDHSSVIKFHDQDVINVLLKGKINTLHHKWNALERYFSPSYTNKSDEISETIKCPMIIHYTNGFKPWNFGCKHPLRYKYFNTLKSIPWGNPKLQRFTAFKRVGLGAKIVLMLGGSVEDVAKLKKLFHH